MIIKIVSVNMRYNPEQEVESVQVHFNGHDEKRTINVSGYVPLSAEEYEGNEAVTSLETIVRERVSTKILEIPNAE